MELNKQKNIITHTSISILEEIAFIFSDEMDSENIHAIDINTWNPSGFFIDFTGEQSGSIHLWGNRNFAQIIATNMLGYDEEQSIPSNLIDDSLKELTNVLTGNILTALFGEELLFNLSIPEEKTVNSIGPDLKNSSSIWLTADEHTLLITPVIK